jgi:signal transduction histidine kinase
MERTPVQAKVLAVDDDERSLKALQALLEDESWTLATARSGEEALRAVLHTDFAAILMDARMPGMDGFETARLIRQRERSRHTPIIFLTAAFEDAPAISRSYEAGAIDYIVKPPQPYVLRCKVAAFVDLYVKNATLVREINERARAEAQLLESQHTLRALTAKLESVREEERVRMSREIHDELGQALSGLKMDLAWIVQRMPADSDPLREKARSMAGLIDQTVGAVQKIASRLRPEVLDRLGLAAAIRWQASEFQLRSGIRCGSVVPESELPLDNDRATATFRIFQELLTNVARHANATRVDVTVGLESDALLLTVEDNGRGIGEEAAQSPASLGLLGARERARAFAGDVDVVGAPGMGTRATVRIPFV